MYKTKPTKELHEAIQGQRKDWKCHREEGPEEGNLQCQGQSQSGRQCQLQSIFLEERNVQNQGQIRRKRLLKYTAVFVLKSIPRDPLPDRW